MEHTWNRSHPGATSDTGDLMKKFESIGTPLEDVVIIQPHLFSDTRGFFLESYNAEEFTLLGILEVFVQDNHSCSRKGVIRGLHYQSRYPQGKLVRVLRGSIYDVIVDIRKGSPKYGMNYGIVLSSDTPRMVYIPPGFAHGFLALEDRTEVHYKTTDFYHPEYDAGIRWNDPTLGIQWPLIENGIEHPLLSPKDALLPFFSEINSPFQYSSVEQ